MLAYEGRLQVRFPGPYGVTLPRDRELDQNLSGEPPTMRHDYIAMPFAAVVSEVRDCVRRHLVALTCVLAASLGAQAAPLTPGNVLVSSIDSGVLYEYTRTGGLVQTFQFPDVDGDGFFDLRDITVDTRNRVLAYNGTFDPHLSVLNPVSGAFQHPSFAGWSTVNNLSFGGIDSIGDFAFVTDMRTFGDSGADEAKGIVRFDLTDFSATRFAEFEGYQDLSIGLDGLLYALPGEGLPASVINVFDPSTLALLHAIPLSLEVFLADLRAITADENGSVYAAGWNGHLYQIGATGAIINSLVTGFSNLNDIDIAAGGQLIAGSRFGDVILTTSDLSSQTSFPAAESSNVHVAFVRASSAVPEPAVPMLLVMGALGWLVARRRRTVSGAI